MINSTSTFQESENNFIEWFMVSKFKFNMFHLIKYSLWNEQKWILIFPEQREVGLILQNFSLIKIEHK